MSIARTFTQNITNNTELELGYSIEMITEVSERGRCTERYAEIRHNGEIIAQTDYYATQIECSARAHDLVTEDIASRAAQVEPAAVVVVQTVNPRAALRTLDAPTEAAITNATGGKSEANIFFRREHGGYILLHNATVYTTAGRRKARKTAADVAALAKLVSDLIDGWHVAAMLAGWTWREIDNDCVWFAPVVASQSGPKDDEIDADIIYIDYDRSATDEQPACHRCGASSMLVPHYGDVDTLICPECEATSSGPPETLAVAAECGDCKDPEYRCSDCSSRLCFWHVMYFNMQPFCWHCRNKKIDAPAKAIELAGGLRDCQPF